MSKEIMDDYDAGFKKGQHDLNRIVALKEDLAYEKGLLDGYTKSIALIRNLQRSDRRSLEIAVVRQMLEQAMELIAEKIEPNTNEVD
tara:strand:+ start:732 stop:992 length:261 start_codon:yes stop_codon:yes gene_type:complete